MLSKSIRQLIQVFWKGNTLLFIIVMFSGKIGLTWRSVFGGQSAADIESSSFSNAVKKYKTTISALY